MTELFAPFADLLYLKYFFFAKPRPKKIVLKKAVLEFNQRCAAKNTKIAEISIVGPPNSYQLCAPSQLAAALFAAIY